MNGVKRKTILKVVPALLAIPVSFALAISAERHTLNRYHTPLIPTPGIYVTYYLCRWFPSDWWAPSCVLAMPIVDTICCWVGFLLIIVIAAKIVNRTSRTSTLAGG